MTDQTLSVSTVLGALNDIQRRHAPAEPHVRGDASLLGVGPRVMVVGSRAASFEGLSRARALAIELVRGGVVVSGMAASIDTAAHVAAMDAGGRTIAVLGTPLEVAYPAENASLHARLAAEQLLVSQFRPGTPISPKNFPIRNRLMTLLTDATVIVEAAEKSGTIQQGWEVLRLGRLLFLLENLTQRSDLAWPKEMLRHGAQVLKRENLQHMIENLPATSVAQEIAADA